MTATGEKKKESQPQHKGPEKSCFQRTGEKREKVQGNGNSLPVARPRKSARQKGTIKDALRGRGKNRVGERSGRGRRNEMNKD